MPLPVGASIATFVGTIIGWYFTLRSGVQLIHDDYKSIKSYTQDIDDLVNELKHACNGLAEWRARWLLSYNCPDALYEKLWGQDDFQIIRAELKSMNSNREDAEKSLRKYIKLGKEQQTNIEKWKARKKWRKKLSFISMKKSYIRSLLEKTSRHLNNIDAAAKRGWRLKNGDLTDSIEWKQVYHRGAGYLLVQAAMYVEEEGNILESCSADAQSEVDVELLLDLFVDRDDSKSEPTANQADYSALYHRESYVKGLSEAVQKQRLVWSILSKSSAQIPGTSSQRNMVRLDLERVNDHPPNMDSLHIAFRNLTHGKGREKYFRKSDTVFRISPSKLPWSGKPGPNTTLTDMLLKKYPHWSTSDPVIAVSKCRLAFQLAQACLLLLRTTWFSKICRNCIQCDPYDNHPKNQYGFSVRIGNLDHPLSSHEEDLDADLERDLQRCLSTHCVLEAEHKCNSLTKPLRRLGALLIEIILECPVIGTMVDDNYKVMAITCRTESGSITTQSKEDILQAVYERCSRSQKVREACDYCLSETMPDSPTDQDRKIKLAELYSRVVAPLKDQYDDRFDIEADHGWLRTAILR